MIVGITGGIGSGKTTFSKMLHNNSINTLLLLTDDIAKNQQKVGEVSYNAIVENFGTSILNKDKTINSKALGNIVFNNNEKLQLLNSITHPNVISFIENIIFTHPTTNILIESALLFDCELVNMCNYTIIVDTPLEKRVEWLRNKRKLSTDKINSIISKQNNYTKLANFIVMNNSDFDNLNYESMKLATLLSL